MTKIPTHLTETQFQHVIEPYLTKAKRGYVSEQPLYKIFNYILYKLYTGCQWEALPIEKDENGQNIMSYQGIRSGGGHQCGSRESGPPGSDRLSNEGQYFLLLVPAGRRHRQQPFDKSASFATLRPVTAFAPQHGWT